MKKLLSLVLMVFALQGCVSSVNGLQQGFDDQMLQSNLNDLVQAQTQLIRVSNVNVTVFDGIVVLTGQTPLMQYRDSIQQLIAKQPNVGTLYNEITIEKPISTSDLANDAWITTKVKSQMVLTSELNSTNIKITTEDGYVYLIGDLTAKQAELAVSVARQISGVKQVVKVMKIS